MDCDFGIMSGIFEALTIAHDRDEEGFGGGKGFVIEADDVAGQCSGVGGGAEDLLAAGIGFFVFAEFVGRIRDR